jgi:hypothetical protein
MWQQKDGKKEKRYRCNPGLSNERTEKIIHLEHFCRQCVRTSYYVRAIVAHGISVMAIRKGRGHLMFRRSEHYELQDVWDHIFSFLYVRMESILLYDRQDGKAQQQRKAITVYGEPAWHGDHVLQMFRFHNALPVLHDVRLLYTDEEELALLDVLE